MDDPTELTLASPPRPITPQVRRRAWMESGVRLWWICAVASILAALAVLGVEAYDWYTQKKLIEQSVIVKAKAYETNGRQLPGRNLAIEGGTFDVRFKLEGKDYAVEGPLEGRTGHIVSGDEFEIRVDPKDPQRWTARVEPPSFSLRWLGPAIAISPALPLLLIGFFMRSRVISLFRNGEQRTASVVARGTTPTAPLSSAVRCALLDGDDRRVINVLLPSKYGRPAKGDLIELIVDPKNIVRAIAAEPFIG